MRCPMMMLVWCAMLMGNQPGCVLLVHATTAVKPTGQPTREPSNQVPPYVSYPYVSSKKLAYHLNLVPLTCSTHFFLSRFFNPPFQITFSTHFVIPPLTHSPSPLRSPAYPPASPHDNPPRNPAHPPLDLPHIPGDLVRIARTCYTHLYQYPLLTTYLTLTHSFTHSLTHPYPHLCFCSSSAPPTKAPVFAPRYGPPVPTIPTYIIYLPSLKLL